MCSKCNYFDSAICDNFISKDYYYQSAYVCSILHVKAVKSSRHDLVVCGL